jgi:hypothetical protein
MALVSCYTLPDEPLSTRWLSPAERQLAHARIARDTVDHQESSNVWLGLKEAIVDRNVWVFIFMQHMHLGESAGVNIFYDFESELVYLTRTEQGIISEKGRSVMCTNCETQHSHQWLQEFLPYNRQDAGLQPHNHPRPHLPTLLDCRYPLHRMGLVIRAA